MNPHDLAIETVVTIKAGEVAMWQCRVLICIVYECMTAESQRSQNHVYPWTFASTPSGDPRSCCELLCSSAASGALLTTSWLHERP